MQLDLSTLRAPELRRLLDTARERGQAAQSYQILQEMARRREGGQRSGSRRPAEPRVISLNLGDPLDVQEDPLEISAPQSEPMFEQASQPTPDPTADLTLERPTGPKPRRPSGPRLVSLNLGDPLDIEDDPLGIPEPKSEPVFEQTSQPTPELTAGLTLERPARPEPRRRLSAWPLAVFVAGAAAGVAFGGSFGGNSLTALSSGFELPGVGIAAASPPVLPTAAVAPVEATTPPDPASRPLDTALEIAAPEQLEVVVSPTEAPEVAAQAVEPTSLPPAPTGEPAEVQQAAAPAAESCAAATPADRTICASPQLQRLQGDLRAAYAHALDAHADRTLLRQRQLAWRDARNTVTDPERLARLYEARIRKLDAATADARKQR